MNLAYGQGGLKLEINIPSQHILAKSKWGLIIEGGVISSEYGTSLFLEACIALLIPYTLGHAHMTLFVVCVHVYQQLCYAK